VVWKRVVLSRPERGRERERKREPAGNPRIPAGSISISGRAWVSSGSSKRYPTFRFRSYLDQQCHRLRVQISTSSHSRRSSQSPARERRRRTRGRGRGRDEVETLRERFFFEGREINLGPFKKKNEKK